MATDFAEAVGGATEALRTIPEFMEALSDVIRTPYGWILLLIVLVWLVRNLDYPNLVSLIGAKEKKRLEKIETYAAKSQLADGKTLGVVKDLRDAYYFKIATGIYAEKDLRYKLIELYEKTSISVSWTTIKRALPYLNISDGTIRDFSLLEQAERIFNLFAGFLVLTFTIAVSLVFLFTAEKNAAQFLIWIGTFMVFFPFSLYAFSQNFPYQAAEIIRKDLKELLDSADRSKD